MREYGWSMRMMKLPAGNWRGSNRSTESGRVSYGFIGGAAFGTLAISLGLVLSAAPRPPPRPDRVLAAARVASAGLALSARTESARLVLSGDRPAAPGASVGRERGTGATTGNGAVERG